MIKNAVIESAWITNEDRGCITMWLQLNYGGSGQGFGGYALYSPTMKGAEATGFFIWRVMEVVGVNRVNDLAGKSIRVSADINGVSAIGNILEDEWFYPKEELEGL